jgi:hypothetical protein
MLREKRNVKAPTSFEQIYQEAQLKNNYLMKNKQKHPRCEFELLQKPNKCLDTYSYYPLPGVENFSMLLVYLHVGCYPS